MKKNWKIEIRPTGKVCDGPLPNARYRTYCSTKCRVKSDNAKSAEYSLEWQRKKRDAIASAPSADKCQCLICGKWYVQICSHAYQVHHLTGREYREKFELEVKRGIVPEWYRKLKGEIALDNETYKNLEAGAKFQFKKGDKVPVYKRSPTTVDRLRKNMEKLHTCKSDSDGI